MCFFFLPCRVDAGDLAELEESTLAMDAAAAATAAEEILPGPMLAGNALYAPSRDSGNKFVLSPLVSLSSSGFGDIVDKYT
mmetsp:Transcript_7371/g.15201  ORF Transcript_7371/g.15201 Transcript_7371/m.15201 type:complete len:81 (-) Transcript_7371:89-331(-)